MAELRVLLKTPQEPEGNGKYLFPRTSEQHAPRSQESRQIANGEQRQGILRVVSMQDCSPPRELPSPSPVPSYQLFEPPVSELQVRISPSECLRIQV